MLALRPGERTTLFTRGLGKKASGRQVRSAMKTYTSALLVQLGNNKDLLLKQMELNEAEWIKLWCRVFEYTPEDMQAFDQVMIPAFQKAGFDGLVKATGKQLVSALCAQDKGDADYKKILKGALFKDIAAILRFTKGEQTLDVPDR
jgi:hypothetical protein